jgi:hypothetical protein
MAFTMRGKCTELLTALEAARVQGDTAAIDATLQTLLIHHYEDKRIPAVAAVLVAERIKVDPSAGVVMIHELLSRSPPEELKKILVEHAASLSVSLAGPDLKSAIEAAWITACWSESRDRGAASRSLAQLADFAEQALAKKDVGLAAQAAGHAGNLYVSDPEVGGKIAKAMLATSVAMVENLQEFDVQAMLNGTIRNAVHLPEAEKTPILRKAAETLETFAGHLELKGQFEAAAKAVQTAFDCTPDAALRERLLQTQPRVLAEFLKQALQEQNGIKAVSLSQTALQWIESVRRHPTSSPGT